MSCMYHVAVAVSDISRSKEFYNEMFDRLGWTTTFEDEESKAYSDGKIDYWIIPAAINESNRHNDGVGYNHLAILVEDKQKVDKLYEWLLSVKAKIDIEPKEYPDYSDKYYAVFFFDPDGTRLEIVYK